MGDRTNNYDTHMNFLGKWLTNDAIFFFFFSFFAFTKLSKDNLGFLKYVHVCDFDVANAMDAVKREEEIGLC